MTDWRIICEAPSRILTVLRARFADRKADRVPLSKVSYADWVTRFSSIGPEERLRLTVLQGRLAIRPRISVFLDAEGAGPAQISISIRSVQDQIYDRWEILVVSPPKGFAADNRNRAVSLFKDGDAGRSLIRSAMEAARGEIVVLLNAGDRLSPLALTAVAMGLAQEPSAIALYSDEDTIDAVGTRSDPWFKGAWSPDQVLAQAYPLRLGALRRDALPWADCPLGLSATAAFYAAWVGLTVKESPTVVHVPFVLYHRGQQTSRAEPDEFNAVLRASAIVRENGIGVRALGENGWRRLVWPVPSPSPRISLCIPTRDRVGLLSTCIEGLRHSTEWPDLEIIVVDNGSIERETLDYLAAISADSRVKIVRDEGEFNFSRLNNLGASIATGTLFGLINNDLAIRDPGWLREMASHALRPNIGAVGALLYYGDDTVQHTGVVLGIGGSASHIHKGLPAGNSGYHGRARVVQDVSCVTAACLLTRLKLYQELGGLDEEVFPVAYNDVDFCLRVRERGLRILFTPHASLYHLESASRGRDDGGARRARLDRDKAALQSRWSGALAADPFYSPNLSVNSTDCCPAWPPRVSPPWAVPPT